MPPPKAKYQPKLRFRMKIGGEEVCRFRSCSEISSEFEIIEEHEGGDPDVADIQLGKRKVGEFTLAAGASDNEFLWNHWKKQGDPETGEQQPENVIKLDIELEERGPDLVTVVRKWKFPKCLMKKFVAGDFDGSSSDNAVRSATFVTTKLQRAL